MSANSPLPFRFHLRGDFHQEVGWRNFVRSQATTNPEVIRSLLAKRPRLDLGADPLTLLERWEPHTMGCMFYFWMIRKGQVAPSFVATDSIFTMYFDPLPRDEHLVGLPSDLLELAHEALIGGGASVTPSPVLPILVDGKPARADVFPDQMVIHRYAEEVAYLRPCVPTLRALAADPAGWTLRETGREGFQG